MPPKTTNPIRRKGPAFKPPRPVKQTAEASISTKRAAGGAPSHPVATTKKPTLTRPGFQPAATIISSSESEQEDNDALSDLDRDEPMNDELNDDDTTQVRRASQLPLPSPIPPKLLNTLLHHGFEDKKTQIQQGAMDLVDTYLQTFVREAIARAKFERGDAKKMGDAADNSLQVEDLEKLAPQLVLDF